MNILFVAPRFPLPANTGAKIRTLNLLKQAARNHNVSLVSFIFEDTDYSFIEGLNRCGIRVYLVKAPQKGFFKKAFDIAFSDLPFSIKKYYSEKMGQKIKELLKAERYDLLHFDHLHMAPYVHCDGSIPSILDEHNVETAIWQQLTNMEQNLFRKIIYKNQLKKIKNLESQTAHIFKRRFVPSEKDREYLAELSDSGRDICILPNGVDTEYFKSQNAKPQEDALVFTGSMDWMPNSDAVEYFCSDILPLIWKEKEEIKFYIVGKNPPKNIISLKRRDDRIVITKEVEDVRPYMEKAKVFVVPIRIGGGTRLKVLEAMSMQRAVVSTPLGAEGIDYKEDMDIVLAEKPQVFADKVISLLKDNKRIKDLGLNGRRLVCEKYDWNIIGQKLNNIYKEVLNVS